MLSSFLTKPSDIESETTMFSSEDIKWLLDSLPPVIASQEPSAEILVPLHSKTGLLQPNYARRKIQNVIGIGTLTSQCAYIYKILTFPDVKSQTPKIWSISDIARELDIEPVMVTRLLPPNPSTSAWIHDGETNVIITRLEK